MAAHIYDNDRYGEVRKNGQRAWHGLGVEIESGLSAQQGFEEIGLGWRTILAPVTANVEGLEEDGSPSSRIVPLPDTRAHLRADDLSLLGVVSDGYKPLENMDLARFADALSAADDDGKVIMETGGSLYNGRRIFALVRLPEQVRATDEDVLDQYVLISNGHGATAAFSVYPTSVRVVCANTLRWSERDIAKGLRFIHTGDFEAKVVQARVALDVARAETERFQEQVSLLVRTNLTAERTREFMQRVWAECFRVGNPAKMGNDTRMRMEASRDKLVAKWLVNLENERQALKGIQGTAWAAYNSVAEWQDHERGRFKGIDESDARMASNVFGTSHRQKLRAFRMALQLAE